MPKGVYERKPRTNTQKIVRERARDQGLITYEGTLCGKCGGTLRNVHSGNCVACLRMYLKAYFVKRYGTNKKFREAIRASQYRYWHDPKNKEKLSASNIAGRTKRRLKESKAGGSYTAKDWRVLKSFTNHLCLCCRRRESELPSVLQRDHVISIHNGGSNWLRNIQPLCAACNRAKSSMNTDYRGRKERAFVNHLTWLNTKFVKCPIG